MKRSDEIIEALKTFFEKYECKMDADTKLIYVGAFAAGATWADEHPKNIWHDATSEEPQGEYEIMCQDEFEGVWLTCYRKDIKDYKNGWKECVAGDCIVRWAYIKDILPEGGEE